ncbi:hypothetical protein HALLA_03455 (plasmid) [Halostagnicola larsenii XH-48]|uniref:Uncharacterized protein n=1 Tax=Halostagnicola larsenii XH-48 TaxID=797299 RepID=W0JWM8_9EURY|nr:hypothetical protein [Halostagnicola larsenii]AHG01458.1 hypothetical protein HALLA_03455 [Halostagnicola larsenii XH-48]
MIFSMPSTTNIDRPEEALAVANRYHRRERTLTVVVAVVAVSLYLGVYYVTSLLPAVVTAVVLLVTVRAPLLQPRGTYRLKSDDDPEAVVDAFTGPTPPVLAFNWGIADEITTREEEVTYHVSYLLGLRSAEMDVQREIDHTQNGRHRVTLEITANDKPWATYTATISQKDGETSIDVEYISNQRFGLQHVPNQFFGERYREDALTAQGYTVLERESHFGI